MSERHRLGTMIHSVTVICILFAECTCGVGMKWSKESEQTYARPTLSHRPIGSCSQETASGGALMKWHVYSGCCDATQCVVQPRAVSCCRRLPTTKPWNLFHSTRNSCVHGSQRHGATSLHPSALRRLIASTVLWEKTTSGHTVTLEEGASGLALLAKLGAASPIDLRSNPPSRHRTRRRLLQRPACASQGSRPSLQRAGRSTSGFSELRELAA